MPVHQESLTLGVWAVRLALPHTPARPPRTPACAFPGMPSCQEHAQLPKLPTPFARYLFTDSPYRACSRIGLREMCVRHSGVLAGSCGGCDGAASAAEEDEARAKTEVVRLARLGWVKGTEGATEGVSSWSRAVPVNGAGVNLWRARAQPRRACAWQALPGPVRSSICWAAMAALEVPDIWAKNFAGVAHS